MSILVCGSFAYDTIMVFPDRFKNHILPEKVHILNVSFLVPEMRREYGGCAGNISYNLKLLGADVVPMGTVGRDFGPYAAWMDQHGLARDHVTEVEETYTAQAFITTDIDDNQITAFHPGAMSHGHLNRITDAVGISLGIVSPDGHEAMIEHAQQFARARIPFVFDPGQGLPMFDQAALRQLLEQATWLTVNDYESEMFQETSGFSLAEIAAQVDALIVTKGSKGSQIHAADEVHEIPAAPPTAVTDPTGCGDAYRAGLLYGLARQLDWPTTGRIGSLMGAIKVAHHGTQNHRFTLDEFRIRYESAFSSTFPLSSDR